jgi:hypothetical protein
MDPIDLRAYFQRWKAVEEVEKLESSNTSIETRWRQLNALAGLAYALGILPLEDREEEAARARWLQLKAV